ncbi:MAG: DNA double-strand break repair nuclease NurA [Candidatus Nanohaloarchaea archaeon]|nr:DNA double-strand break repair nuclease NurA [Candidatus Nanohaloarchaea archaeon]
MDLDGLIEELARREEEKAEEAERIRKEAGTTLFDSENVHEESFIHGVEPSSLAGTAVAGVDGGMVRKEYRGVDILFTRAVAAVFEHGRESLESSSYVPGKNPSPRIEFLMDNLNRRQVDRISSLQRLEDEIGTAVEVAPETDFLLLDGSVLPQSMDRPSGNGEAGDRYGEVTEVYGELYDACEREGTVLAGVVEDSRSSVACNALKDSGFSSQVLESGRDTTVLGHLLETGERTLVMDYADADEHPVLNDFEGRMDEFYTFYLKTVENDLPVKVDFHAVEEPVHTAEKIASLLMALSGSGRSYGIPPVLIEADQRAKIEGHELETLLKRIRSRTAHLPGLEDLRRDQRPF